MKLYIKIALLKNKISKLMIREKKIKKKVKRKRTKKRVKLKKNRALNEIIQSNKYLKGGRKKMKTEQNNLVNHS